MKNPMQWLTRTNRDNKGKPEEAKAEQSALSPKGATTTTTATREKQRNRSRSPSRGDPERTTTDKVATTKATEKKRHPPSKKSMGKRRTAPDLSITASGLNQAALKCCEKHEYDRAITFYIKALKLLNHQLLLAKTSIEQGPQPSRNFESKETKEIWLSVATAINNICCLRQQLGSNTVEDSMKGFQNALTIKRRCLESKATTSFAISLNNVGAMYYFQGKTKPALQIYLKALEVFTAASSELDQMNLSTLYSNMGDVYLAQQNQNAKSLGHYRKALEIRWAKLNNHEHPKISPLLAKVGELEMKTIGSSVVNPVLIDKKTNQQKEGKTAAAKSSQWAFSPGSDFMLDTLRLTKMMEKKAASNGKPMDSLLGTRKPPSTPASADPSGRAVLSESTHCSTLTSTRATPPTPTRKADMKNGNHNSLLGTLPSKTTSRVNDSTGNNDLSLLGRLPPKTTSGVNTPENDNSLFGTLPSKATTSPPPLVSPKMAQKELQGKAKALHVFEDTAELDQAGKEYFDKGAFKMSKKFYTKALKVKSQQFVKAFFVEDGDETATTASATQRCGLPVNGNIGQLLKKLKSTVASSEAETKLRHNQMSSMAKTLNNLGAVNYFNQDYEAALESYQEALSILTDVYGAHHMNVGTVHSNIGDVYFAQQQTKALEHYRLALEIRWAQVHDHHNPKVVRLLEKIAELEMGAFDLEQSRRGGEGLTDFSCRSMDSSAYMLRPQLMEDKPDLLPFEVSSVGGGDNTSLEEKEDLNKDESDLNKLEKLRLEEKKRKEDNSKKLLEENFYKLQEEFKHDLQEIESIERTLEYDMCQDRLMLLQEMANITEGNGKIDKSSGHTRPEIELETVDETGDEVEGKLP